MSINNRDSYENSKRTRIVTREEEAKIVDILRSPEINSKKKYYKDVADLVEVLVDTGMRLGESLMIKYVDIHFEDRLINIRSSMKSAEKHVPMTKRVVNILKCRQQEDQHKPFNLSAKQVQKAWAWARIESGIDDAECLVLHSLRHTCARRLIDTGCYIGIIYEWFGYSTTRNIHKLEPLPPHKLIEAAEKLEK